MQIEKRRILVVRKMSALEYYYKNSHKSRELRESRKEQDKNIENLEKILQEKNQQYKIVTRKELDEKILREYDFVFSAGGDGTAVATAAYNIATPQLNLKTDKKSKGLLCQENIEKATKSVLAGDYQIEKWTRQDVSLDNIFVGRALNETCVGEQLNFSKMAKYEIEFLEFEDIKREYHENSGLIITTGTGSTAWPFVFEPSSKKSEMFKFKTIFPTIGSEQGESDYFKIIYKKHKGKFALDTIEYKFPRDSMLEIKISRNPLLVAIPNYKK